MLRYEGPFFQLNDYVDSRIDNTSSIAEKREFLAQKRGQTFTAALDVVRYNFLDSQITLLSVHAYLKQSFHLQDQLRAFFKTPNVPGTINYLHGLSPPFLSNGGLA